MSRPATATLIRNGRVITASDDYVADVLMRDGVIHTIGQYIEAGEDVAVLDATGLYVLPGGVDTHVHLENTIGPSVTCDTFASGTRAAALAVGSDADVVLFNPAATQTIHAHHLHGNCDYTLLEGRSLRGRVEKVFLRGSLIVDGPRWLGREGMGRFVPRGQVRAF